MVGVLEKAVGPAVWSIAEVNLGRVTVPFVSLSLSLRMQPGMIHNTLNRSMQCRKTPCNKHKIGQYCSGSSEMSHLECIIKDMHQYGFNKVLLGQTSRLFLICG